MNKNKNISSFTIIVVFLSLTIAGISLLPLLPVKLVPSRSLPRISVNFSMRNSSPRVVEMEATSKLEAMLARVKGIKSINSRSGNGNGSITLVFDKHKSIDVARFEVSTIIRQAWSELPETVSYPYLSVARPDEKSTGPFLTYTLNSAVLPIIIQNYANNVIKTKLSSIKGIYKIDVTGATPMEWQLEYDNDVLQALDINISDIRNAIRLYYSTDFIGMGEIEQNGKKIYTRVVLGKNIKNSHFDASLIPVKTNQGKIIYLNELVKIKKVEESPRSYFRINGLNSIYISFLAEETANQLKLSKKVKKALGEIEKDLPPGYELYQSYDATEFIKNELFKIYFRSGFTILILLFFVFLISRNLRYLFLIVVSLLVNLSIAFIFYYFIGLEIQLYSLAGITISLSLIIDNTIIMTDHLIYQKNRLIFMPILAATLTTIGALSIIFFLDENIRLNLQDFAAVVMINLFASLAVALFFVPSMVDKIKLTKQNQGKHKKLRFLLKRINVKMSLFYQFIITLLSKRKWIVYVFFILLFGIPTFSLPEKIEKETKWAKFYNSSLGSTFYKEKIKPVSDKVLGGTLRLFAKKVHNGGYFNRENQTVLSITASMPSGTTLAQMNFLIMKMESYLTSFKEIKQFQTRVNNPNRASISVFFTKDAEDSGFPYELKNNVISKAIELGGGSWGVYGLEDRGFNNDVREYAGQNKVKLTGYNYDELYMWADTLKNRLKKYRRVEEITINSDFSWYKDDYKEFLFDLNKHEIAISNISPYSIFYSLNNVFAKDVYVDYLTFKDRQEKIKLYSKQSKLRDVWALNNIGENANNQFYKLSKFAKIKKSQIPKDVVKENQQYKLALQYSYIGSYFLAKSILKKELKSLNEVMPTGYKAENIQDRWYWGSEGINKQYLLLLLLVVIIFFTTSILFNSLKQPFIVILIIPISFIGVFLTFYWFSLNFDQGGFASFILLSGITVNASIYILNEYNNILKTYPLLNSKRAYIKAWNRKIIPILLTIISTILGFIPFIIGLKRESFWFPLAAGTIGGLIMSLIGIFILLPMFVVKKEKRKKL